MIKRVKKINSYIIINNTNLDILDISLSNISELLNISSINNKYQDDIFNNTKKENINIGFNNIYRLHTYNNIDDKIPFNLLVYIKEIDQVVIKIGNDKKYQFINSKLYKTYNIKNNIDNGKSILCNNNIKKLNKKCQNGNNCKYYHDIILGYPDNAHKVRQFSCNPIIYNCANFKDGTYVKENIKKIDWVDAINLYQSNLSCILIACMHASN